MLGKWYDRIYSARISRRLSALYRSFKHLGHNVRIDPSAEIHFPERISIGDNVLIHRGAYISGEGEVEIGSNVVASVNLSILSSTHNFEDCELLPWDEKTILEKVTIEDNVWFGLNVIVLPGVTIHEGAVVGAGSVVTRDVEKCAIVAGNPAKAIKYRDIEHYTQLKNKGKFRLHPTDDTTSTIVLGK